MIDVALFNHEGPVTLAEVSERQKFPSLPEQLFGKLRRHGLVESVRPRRRLQPGETAGNRQRVRHHPCRR